MLTQKSKWGIVLIVRVCCIMAITSAFQAEDAGSIPVGRLAPKNGAFFLFNS